MTKKLIVTRTAWGGHQIDVYSGNVFIRDYRTTRRLSRCSEEYLEGLAKLLEVPKNLIDKAVAFTIKKIADKEEGRVNETGSVKHRDDLGLCGCGCKEYMQKYGKKFLPGHYNLLVKKMRDCLKSNNKGVREWALTKMSELEFTERNLYVGGKLPKGVKL